MKRVIKPVIKPILTYTPSRWTSPSLALRTVTSKSGLGVYASSDTLFKGAVFGRDSLEVAEDLMDSRPKLVEKILLTLGSLQGEKTNHANEEEPGKIIHEYRTTRVDGKPIDRISKDIFDRLSIRWGGDDGTLAYYGSVDSTPHFVKVLSTYCQTYGMEILTKQVRLRSGQKASMLSVMDDAIEWLTRHIDNSKSGLVEYKRVNPHGIENQVWKDSVEFYVHESGELANHDRPISSIEVQGLAYDALNCAAVLLPSKSVRLNKYARELQQKTINCLWDESRQYFYLGTDFDEDGKLRYITTITANPAELLDTTFFDSLTEDEKQKYIGGLVHTIMGDDFLTDAGIRSRSLKEAKLVSFWDYHGSFTSWPKETYDIAKGLQRQGLLRLAQELENRLLNVMRAMKSYPEFIYIDKRGRVLGMPRSSQVHGELVLVDSHNSPERIQAWTVSAIISIIYKQRWWNKHQHKQNDWQTNLEKEIISLIPHVPKVRSAKALALRYPAYPYKLARARGGN